MNPTPTPNFLDRINRSIAQERWIKMLQQGRVRKLTEDFCITFQHFADYSYATLPDDKYEVVNGIVSQFLFIMSQPSYRIPERYIAKLVELGPVIANVVAMSRHLTTDEALLEVIGRPDNFHKVLVLYSARNHHQIKAEALFRIDPVLASQWYWSYFVCPGSYPSETVYENMRRHVNYIDPQLRIRDLSVVVAYFNSTYIDNVGYRKLKGFINAQVQDLTKGVPVDNKPDGTIAVCTGKWYPRSSVYRCNVKAVHAIGKRHRMELINLGAGRDEIDKFGFDRIHHLSAKGLFVDTREIAKNNYSAVFFPDIGMDFQGIFLSNIRLAPVQIMGYGHPSSTFGAKIDYVIGGADLEITEDAKMNYSETLVTIPGNGQPTQAPCHLDPGTAFLNRGQHLRPDRVVVNCPWSQDKTTWPLIECLRKIKDRCINKPLFRLFPNEAINRMNYFIPYLQGVIETMRDPDCVEVHQAFGQDYLTRMAAGDMSLDSWPFNGYNTILDSLVLGLPVVTLKGRQCFERVGAELLNRIGVPELIAESEQEYIDKAVALIDNPSWRGICAAKIQEKPINLHREDGEVFADTFDKILAGDYKNEQIR